MKNIRLTFTSPTNFNIPLGVNYVLQRDALYYGFIKNKAPNISGFLNNLIPALSDYQEDLFKELLKANRGDVEKAKNSARDIHNVYLCPFTFHDDSTTTVSFRISKDKYNDFIVIHDDRLAFYDTDFTNYVRTLLSEYASKTLGQREYLYAFKMIPTIREAIRKGNICKFYTNEPPSVFTPVSIETSPVYDHNHIVGIDSEGIPRAIRLSETKNIHPTNNKIKVTKKHCESITDYLFALHEKEYNECSD